MVIVDKAGMVSAFLDTLISHYVFDDGKGADYCATIYTRPKPEGAFPGKGGLSVVSKDCPIHIDTSHGQIACIEALDQPKDVRLGFNPTDGC